MDEQLAAPGSLDAYVPHLGSRFMVADTAVTLTLTQANPVPARGSPRQDPFQLCFQEKGWSLPQGIHLLQHPDMGSLAIFLTPIGPDKDAEGCFLYQAVFN